MTRSTLPHRAGAALSALVCAGAACTADLVDVTVDNRRPFQALEVYALWWAQVEDCSSIRGPYARVEWFVADGLRSNRQLVLATWDPPHRITLLANQVETEAVVKHEMLHDLLEGDPDHRASAWDACTLRSPTG